MNVSFYLQQHDNDYVDMICVLMVSLSLMRKPNTYGENEGERRMKKEGSCMRITLQKIKWKRRQ